jgi:hypothetical protein
MTTAIRISGNRSKRITVTTTTEALASAPMKVKSVIKKRINAMGVSSF